MKGKLLFLFADALQASVQAVVVIMVAFRYGATGVAAYGFAVSLSMPITTFFSASLRKVAATSGGKPFGSSEMFRLRHMLTLATIVTAVIAVFFYYEKAGKDYLWLFLALTCYKTAERYYELLQGFYQKEGRKKELAINNIGKSVGFMFCFVPALFVFDSLVIVFFLCVLFIGFYSIYAWKALCGMADLEISSILGKAANTGDLQKLITIGLPLAFLALFVSLNIHLPRLILENRFEAEVFASFILQMNFFSMFSVVIISLSQYSLSTLSNAYRNREMRKYYLMSVKVICLALVVYVAYRLFMTLVSYKLVGWFYPDVEYLLYQEVLAGVLAISLPLFIVTALSFVIFPFYKHVLSLLLNAVFVVLFWVLLSAAEEGSWFELYAYIVWGQAVMTVALFGSMALYQNVKLKKKGSR